MDSSGIVANGIGQPVRRKEDLRLLTGKGSFADDIQLPGLAHAMMVRSPHAHAHITSVDKAAALASPGVLAVLTGRDYVSDGLEPIPHNAGFMGKPDVAVRVRGFEPITTRDYPMPPDKARFVTKTAIQPSRRLWWIESCTRSPFSSCGTHSNLTATIQPSRPALTSRRLNRLVD
jgi:hypothetical protein